MLTKRLRREAGFTLIEMLMAMVIGMITILAAFALIDATTTSTAQVTGRTDATQRGRQALDTMTRSLRSQVCVNGAPPITSADANQITFTADLSGTGNSDLRQLTFDPTGRTITLGVKAGSGTEGTTTGRTFPGAYTNNTLLSDVVADGATPIFAYFADVSGTGGTQQTQLTTLPLSTADLKRVARIDIAFVARPTGAATTATWASTLEDSVTPRGIDPTDTIPTFQCP